MIISRNVQRSRSSVPSLKLGVMKKFVVANYMTSQVQKHLTMLMGVYREVKRGLEELENKPEPPKAKRPKSSTVYQFH